MYLMYLRKSRADESGATVQEVLAKHEAMLQEYCVKKFGKPLEEKYIYREVVSGETIADRPQIQKLLEKITTEDIAGVFVIEPARLSRGGLSECGQICNCFKFSNTKILTPKWDYDLSNERDFDFFKNELLRSNDFFNYMINITMRGRLIAVKSGQYIGQSAPYGYDKVIIDGKKTLAPNDKAPVVELIYKLFHDGMTPHGIGKELDRRGIKPSYADEWSQKSIHKILTNIHYTGKIKYQERKTEKFVDAYGNIEKKRVSAEPLIYDGLHPAIIDEQTFNAVQDMIGRCTRKAPDKHFASPFASLVKCGCCGYSMTLQTYGHKKRPRFACRKGCGNKSISYDEFTDGVIQALKSAISDFSVEVAPDTTEHQNGLIKAIQSDLLTLEKRLRKIYHAYETDIYNDDEFIEQKTEIEAERERLEQALADEQAKLNQKENFEAFTYTMYEAIDSLKDETIPAERKNRLLKSILHKIVYTRTDDEPIIELFF